MDVLSESCIAFLNQLHKKFDSRRRELLNSRLYNICEFDSATKSIRDGDWECASIPDEIKDRKVEITGPPVPAKMVVNAVTSGANCYMADFEDSLSPTWENILQGHKNLENYTSGKEHWLPIKYYEKLVNYNKPEPVLMVRPRGLHMTENHMFDMSASLFDFGVFLHNCAAHLIRHGTRPYFYLAKLEHFAEARWWADVFKFSENYLGIPEGTIKCTVLIETLPAAFQMDEIVWELRDSITGLNAGRWDYLFSFIKNQSDCLLPDRDDVGMDHFFLRAYAQQIVHICNKRGITPMGGMSAFVPKKGDEETIKKIVADKTLEAQQGFKGAWAAHPGYVETIKDVFEKHKGNNNYHSFSSSDLLNKNWIFGYKQVKGKITDEGLKKNVEVCMKYLVSWLQGNGCVAIDGKMEDAATAEISRMQVWQWLKHEKVSVASVIDAMDEAMLTIELSREVKEVYIHIADTLLHDLFWPSNLENKPDEFLTTSAYKELIKNV